MENHPIENLMTNVMTHLKDMIDVNTIVGTPIPVGCATIIPVSKVVFGFATGGSEFNSETMGEYAKSNDEEEISYKLPFGGGTGAGVNIKPIAFLLIDNDSNAKVIHLDNNSAVEKLINYIPDAFDKISDIIDTSINNKKETEIKTEYIKV